MAALTVISRKPIPFVIAATALVGALLGVLMGMSMGSAPLGLIVGAVISAGLSYVATTVLSEEKTARYALIAVSLIAGGYSLGWSVRYLARCGGGSLAGSPSGCSRGATGRVCTLI